MPNYVGLDVSIETTAVCVLDGDGAIICEASVKSNAEAIADVLRHNLLSIEVIGLESVPMSEWLVRGLLA